MKRRKHTPDQVVRKLREADRLLAGGKDVSEVSKQLEISEQTYHRWAAQLLVLLLQVAQPVTLFGAEAGTTALVALGLADPLAQRLSVEV